MTESSATGRIADGLYARGVPGHSRESLERIGALLAGMSPDIIDTLALLYGVPERAAQLREDPTLLAEALTSDRVAEGVNALLQATYDSFSDAIARRIVVE